MSAVNSLRFIGESRESRIVSFSVREPTCMGTVIEKENAEG